MVVCGPLGPADEPPAPTPDPLATHHIALCLNHVQGLQRDRQDSERRRRDSLVQWADTRAPVAVADAAVAADNEAFDRELTCLDEREAEVRAELVEAHTRATGRAPAWRDPRHRDSDNLATRSTYNLHPMPTVELRSVRRQITTLETRRAADLRELQQLIPHRARCARIAVALFAAFLAVLTWFVITLAGQSPLAAAEFRGWALYLVLAVGVVTGVAAGFCGSRVIADSRQIGYVRERRAADADRLEQLEPTLLLCTSAYYLAGGDPWHDPAVL